MEGGKATFGSDGTITYTKNGKSEPGRYAYAQYSPVGAMVFILNPDGSTRFVQLQFSSASSGSTYETDFDSTGAEKGLESSTFTMQ